MGLYPGELIAGTISLLANKSAYIQGGGRGRACNRGTLTWDFMVFLQIEKNMTTTAASVELYLTHQKYSEYSSTFTPGNTL